MKVLMVEHFLPNSIYSLELCDKLSKDNTVILICSDRYVPTGKEPFSIYPIIHSKSKNPMDAFFRFIDDLKKIRKIVIDEKPDIVHYQGVEHAFFEGLFLKEIRSRKIKTIFTAHNILSHEDKKREKETLSSWYKNFDGIIVHNQMSKKMFHEVSDYEGRVFVIPHGSYDTYKGQIYPKMKNKDKTVFLQFGIIRHYKGVDLLVEAISKLPSDVLGQIQVIIAGSLTKKYYEYDLIAKVEQLGLRDVFTLITERIPDNQVPDLFNNCDCCVFPYRHIYGSGALLMAYTFGKPVLVSDIPVFLEETDNGKTGIVFQRESPDSLANAILEFTKMQDIERKEKTKAIEFLVRSKYNWTNAAALTADAYSCVLGENHAT